MIDAFIHQIASQSGLTVSSGMAYGMLNGCFVALSGEAEALRMSIYVGPQQQPAPGFAESATVSCARQICHTIFTASGPDNHYCLAVGSDAMPALVNNHAGSVVTVNFSPNAQEGVQRFIAEVLPQIAPLTAPKACIYCCTDTAGSAVPVRLSADTVVPMHLPCYQQAAGIHAPTKEEQDVQLRATLGAAGGALVGAILWALLSSFGPVAWIVAVAMGLLPVLAYDLLHGKAGRTRIITVVICALAAVLLGSTGATMLTLISSYNDQLTAFNAMQVGFWAYVPEALTDNPTIRNGALTTFIAGASLAALGCISCFLRPTASAANAADADKPRRMKGSF